MREAAGKPPAGTIVIRCEQGPQGLVVTVDDDGGGLDESALRDRAHELGLDHQARPVEDLAFLPGVSSSSYISELSGRGVGLAAVREDARAVGYEVVLASTPSRGTRTVIRPLAATAPVNQNH